MYVTYMKKINAKINQQNYRNAYFLTKTSTNHLMTRRIIMQENTGLQAVAFFLPRT